MCCKNNAVIECLLCNEIYCIKCFPNYHLNGKNHKLIYLELKH